MTETKDEDVMIATRVPRSISTAFGECADKHNMSVSALMRELVMGFVENRVSITPPKHLADLYSINFDKE